MLDREFAQNQKNKNHYLKYLNPHQQIAQKHVYLAKAKKNIGKKTKA